MFRYTATYISVKQNIMKTRQFILTAALGIILTLSSCIDNNNKDNDSSQGDQNETDYENEAPTYNKTSNDMQEDGSDTTATKKRIPKDPVERQSKGNAASE
jgi:hypothetical protein